MLSLTAGLACSGYALRVQRPSRHIASRSLLKTIVAGHTSAAQSRGVSQAELLRIFKVVVAASGLAIGEYVHNSHHRRRREKSHSTSQGFVKSKLEAKPIITAPSAAPNHLGALPSWLGSVHQSLECPTFLGLAAAPLGGAHQLSNLLVLLVVCLHT